MYHNRNEKTELGNITLLTKEEREKGNRVIKPYGFHGFTGCYDNDRGVLYCDFETGCAVTLGTQIGADLAKAFGVHKVYRSGNPLFVG